MKIRQQEISPIKTIQTGDRAKALPWPFLALLSMLLLFSLPAQSFAEKPAPLEMEIPYGSLSLEKAQQIALGSSPKVAEMLERIHEAEALVEEAKASLWPQVFAHAGHHLKDVSVQPDWNPQSRAEETFQHHTIGVTVNWLLFDGFGRRATILARQAKTRQEQELQRDSRRLLAEAVAGAFFQAQLAREGMQIARQNSLFNRNLEQDALLRFKAGSIPEADYLNFSVKSLKAENTFLEAKRYYTTLCIVLRKLMALPKTSLPPDLHPRAQDGAAELDGLPDLETELGYALAHRPDLAGLLFGQKELLQQKKSKQADYMPRLSLDGRYAYDGQYDLGETNQNERRGAIGLTLRWELFSGGERGAAIRATEARLRQLERRKEEKILEIETGLQKALVAAEASRKVYERERYTLGLVRKIRDHVERSYRAGATTLTRLNEAQTDLISVSAAVATSHFNYLLQREYLRAASGRILEGLVPAEKKGVLN